MAIYPKFETRAVPDENASKEAGRTIYKDEDWVSLRVDANTTVEKPAEEWFADMADKARNGKTDPITFEAYKKIYASFKEGKEAPLNGTDIRLWPQVTKAQAENLIQLGIRTVEDMAVADDNTIRRITHGGRDLQNKAKAYLESREGKAAEKIVDLEKKVTELAEQNEKLLKALEENLQKKRGRPPKETEAA